MEQLILVFVCAHPDDDTFGVTRTIALHRSDPAIRFVLVHATDGEAGEIAPGVEVGPEGLGAIRRREAAESWRVIGRPPDRHVWLGLPDNGVSSVDSDHLIDRIWDILRDEQPDIVATFGEDGITGHPDHIAVGRATTAAFMRGVEAGSSGFRRLLHACIPQSQIDRWNANRMAAGDFVWDAGLSFHLRGVPDESVGISVDTRSVAALTAEALRAHKSQWSLSLMRVPDDVLARSLRTEDWVVAWPSSPPGAILSDVFEGL